MSEVRQTPANERESPGQDSKISTSSNETSDKTVETQIHGNEIFTSSSETNDETEETQVLWSETQIHGSGTLVSSSETNDETEGTQILWSETQIHGSGTLVSSSETSNETEEAQIHGSKTSGQLDVITVPGDTLPLIHAQSPTRNPIHTSTEKGSTSFILNNIAESSRCLIHHSDSQLHVSTYAERAALKILRQYGSILITGKSGSGKSRMGYRLLAEIEKESNRIPLVLTSFRQWKHISQRNPNNDKYVVLIDDIFGCTSFVDSQLENWGKMFGMMHPSVESGHIMLVLSSRPEIHKSCEARLRKYPIMHNMQHIFLDGNKYLLRRTEKIKLLRTYCGKITNLEVEDIEHLAILDPPLGFPQCCVFFAQNWDVQKRGVEFFHKPHEYIAEDISSLKERDPVGYLVLLLIVMMENRLDTRFLTKPPTEFKELIQDLANTCISVSRPPTCGQIREKVNLLIGVYLMRSSQEVSFQHQSIFDAVLVDAARDNQEMFLQKSSAQFLTEFVFFQPKEHAIGIHVEEHMFPTLAKRVTELMFTEDVNVILDHPCFQDSNFVHTQCSAWTMDMMSKLSNQQVKQQSLKLWAFADNDSSPLVDTLAQNTETEMFAYRNLVSLFIMKHLSTLVKLLMPMVDSKEDLDENLVCAVFVQNHEMVMMLLNKGACINDVTLTALCCVNPTASDVTDTVFELVKTQGEVIKNPERKLSLAVQHGNIFAIKRLVDIITSDRRPNTFEHCLIQLFCQCARKHPYDVNICVPYVPSGSIPVVEIVQLLLLEYDSYLIKVLISLAACHEDSSALKYLLDIRIEKDMLSEPLSSAAYVGTAESVGILLQSGAFNEKALNNAARTLHASFDKIQMLLGSLPQNGILHGCELMTVEQFVNLDEYGNVPLHFAVASENVRVVEELLHSGADINIKGDVTPFQLAVFTCNKKSILAFLKIIKNHPTTLQYPVTHFVVEILQRMNLSPVLCDFLRKCRRVSKPTQSQKETLDLLLQHGIGINEVDEDGKSAIFVAAAVGSTQMVKYLHAKGATLNVVDKGGRMVQHEAVKHGDLEMVKYVCEFGCDVNVKDNDGRSVLQETTLSDVEPLEKFVYLTQIRSAVVDDPSKFILDAIPFDNVEIVQYLAENLINVKDSDDIKKAIFFDACRFHSHNIVDYVVNVCNVDVNLMTDSLEQGLKGRTGIHFAVETLSRKGEETVRCLLASGADGDVKDENGNTGLLLSIHTLKNKTAKDDIRFEKPDHFLYEAHLRMIKELTDRGSDVNVVDNNGTSPLHLACQILHPLCADLVRLLLDQGAVVNSVDISGKTPLHHAVENSTGNYELIAVLVDRGANVNANDSDGKTPIDIILHRYRGGPYCKRLEIGKLKIVLDRCRQIEGYSLDVLESELAANYMQ